MSVGSTSLYVQLNNGLPEMTKRLFNGSTIPSGIAFLGLHLMVEGAMTLRGAK